MLLLLSMKLTPSVSAELLEPVAGQGGAIPQGRRRFETVKLELRWPLDARERLDLRRG